MANITDAIIAIDDGTITWDDVTITGTITANATTLDAGTDIILDADNYGYVAIKDAGTELFTLYGDSSLNYYLRQNIYDKSLFFRVNTGTSGSASWLNAVEIQGTNGAVVFNGSWIAGGTSNGYLRMYGDSGSSNFMQINDDGKVGVGANPTRDFEVSKATDSGTVLGLSNWGTSAASSGAIRFQKSRATSIGTFTATADGDLLGSLGFYGSDSSSTASSRSAWIDVAQVGSAGGSSVASKMVFGTASTESMTLSGGDDPILEFNTDGILRTSSGNLTLQAAGDMYLRSQGAQNWYFGTGAAVKTMYIDDMADNPVVFFRASDFGYSTGYKTMIFGSPTGAQTICLGVDVSANTNGGFGGAGQEIFFRNNMQFRSPNDANDGFHSYMVMNDGHISVYNGLVVNELSGSGGDFRVESDSYDHFLFVDASSNRLSIGTSSTDANAYAWIRGGNTSTVSYAGSNPRAGGLIVTDGNSDTFSFNSTYIDAYAKIAVLAVSSEVGNNYNNIGVYGIGRTGGAGANVAGGQFAAYSANSNSAAGNVAAVRIKYAAHASDSTKAYALYSDATAKSYFAGRVGIGPSSPEGKLDIGVPDASSVQNALIIGTTLASGSTEQKTRFAVNTGATDNRLHNLSMNWDHAAGTPAKDDTGMGAFNVYISPETSDTHADSGWNFQTMLAGETSFVDAFQIRQDRGVFFYGATSGQDMYWSRTSSNGCLVLNDNTKAKFGSGGDLEIYHDGSNSFITNSTGSLVLTAANCNINNAANNASMIVMQEGSYVKLYHNGSVKLETQSTGIESSGSNLDVHLRLKSTGTNSYPTVRFQNDTNTWQLYGVNGAHNNSVNWYDETNSRWVQTLTTDGNMILGNYTVTNTWRSAEKTLELGSKANVIHGSTVGNGTDWVGMTNNAYIDVGSGVWEGVYASYGHANIYLYNGNIYFRVDQAVGANAAITWQIPFQMSSSGLSMGGFPLYDAGHGNNYWTSSALYTTGTIYATSTITQNSDVRLKENIVQINSALEKVNQMRGVTYDRIDTGESGVGVIAQELELIAPELIHIAEPKNFDKKDSEEWDDYKSVAYGNLTAYLIEAVKELTEKVDDLERKLGG